VTKGTHNHLFGGNKQNMCTVISLVCKLKFCDVVSTKKMSKIKYIELSTKILLQCLVQCIFKQMNP